ncbi:MAG TPA: CBO0543 family protein, partial [Pseudoneobacillus sp.]|nr:CBO0543 family protein [Pseudoneobacillus sp.]
MLNNISEMIEIKRKLKELRNEHWLNEAFLSFNWCFLLLITILPWLIWWKFVDKKFLYRIICYGAFVSIFSILLDDIGSYYLLWIYQYQLVPITPRLNPIDLSVMPVTYMFVYQYFKKWKTFAIAQTILAFGAAFLCEPIFIWMDIYKPINWKLTFS